MNFFPQSSDRVFFLSLCLLLLFLSPQLMAKEDAKIKKARLEKELENARLEFPDGDESQIITGQGL